MHEYGFECLPPRVVRQLGKGRAQQLSRYLGRPVSQHARRRHEPVPYPAVADIGDGDELRRNPLWRGVGLGERAGGLEVQG